MSNIGLSERAQGVDIKPGGTTAKQVRQDLEKLRGNSRLSCEDYLLDWMVECIIDDLSKGYYTWDQPRKSTRLARNLDNSQ